MSCSWARTGLTRRPTPHSLIIGEHTLNTWCAYDAVAIPVALGATARATTTCPAGQRALTIDIHAGLLPHAHTPVLWMPIGTCERVIDDFCPHANLFCNGEHVHDWRRAAGDPAGQVLTLAQVPELPAPHGPTSPRSSEPSGLYRRFRPDEPPRWPDRR